MRLNAKPHIYMRNGRWDWRLHPLKWAWNKVRWNCLDYYSQLEAAKFCKRLNDERTT